MLPIEVDRRAGRAGKAGAGEVTRLPGAPLVGLAASEAVLGANGAAGSLAEPSAVAVTSKWVAAWWPPPSVTML